MFLDGTAPASACDPAAFAAEVYAPLEEAAAQVREDAKGGEPPYPLPSVPMAVLARQVATPNHELLRFLDLARSCGLRPFVWEFHADRFVSRNPYKRALLRPEFHRGVGRRGGAKVEAVPVADLDAHDGQPLRAVRTFGGRNMVEAHRELLLRAVPADAGLGTADMSPWYPGHGGTAPNYYESFLRLFLCGAVLFETFLFDREELPFSAQVVLPAVRRIAAEAGRKPLICSLDPPGREGDPYWNRYPGTLAAALREILARREDPPDGVPGMPAEARP